MTNERLSGKEDRQMTYVHVADSHELVARREKILRDHGLSFEEIAERAASYTLIGEQWGRLERAAGHRVLAGR
ncbi:MAG TPA: hypothetical protein VH969_29850 [Actinophytocola sp.]|jgi:hypothetical protein|uniref:hypothetical protein n=1 Tax=Actinophytocola sp. TaxID=1872138 RepID=UPI002F92EA31